LLSQKERFLHYTVRKWCFHRSLDFFRPTGTHGTFTNRKSSSPFYIRNQKKRIWIYDYGDL